MSFENRFLLFRPLLVLLVPFSFLLTGCGGPNLIERMSQPQWGVCGTLWIVFALVALFDLLGDETRESTGKVLWALLIVFFPIGGAILYFLFGRD